MFSISVTLRGNSHLKGYVCTLTGSVNRCLRNLDLTPELKLGATNLMEYQSNSTIILIDEY